jgi:hypothetical protein
MEFLKLALMDGHSAAPDGADLLDQFCRVLLWLTNRVEDEPLPTGAHGCHTSVNRCALVLTGVALCIGNFL